MIVSNVEAESSFKGELVSKDTSQPTVLSGEERSVCMYLCSACMHICT